MNNNQPAKNTFGSIFGIVVIIAILLLGAYNIYNTKIKTAEKSNDTFNNTATVLPQ